MTEVAEVKTTRTPIKVANVNGARPKGGDMPDEDFFEGAPQEAATPKIWRTPAQRALALGQYRERLPTGFKTLDEATRGGLPLGRLIVIGGPPGGSKTNLAFNLGDRWTNEGHAVTFHAADEEGDAILIRKGQHEGLDRKLLEEGNETVRKMLHDRVLKQPLFDIVDQEEAEVTIEDTSEAMFKRAGEGRPCIFIADSIQTITTRIARSDDTARSRIDAAMKGLRAIARRGALVIATSEMARGFYRQKRKGDNTTALAAFKESGGVEYGAHVALAIFEDPEAPGYFLVDVAKNRLGQKPSMRLRLEYTSARLEEVSLPKPEDTQLDLEGLPKMVDVSALKRTVLQVLKREPGLTSKNAICTRLIGNKTTKLQAIDELLEEGKVTDLGQKTGGFRAV